MNNGQPDDIRNLYRELFGREADQAGLEYWQTQAPSLISQGGTNKLREAMIGGAAQPDANYYNNRNTSEADWAAYTNRAQQQMAGLNNMPGVFSNYGALAGATPAQANAMMYHDKDSLKSILDDFKALYGVNTIEALPAGGSTGSGNNGGGILKGKTG